MPTIIADATKDLLVKMLKENTGVAMCDSGGENGRLWQRNQEVDFDKVPEITFERYGTDISVTVSVYHFLKANLTLDERCEKFNAIPVKDWDGEGMYGLSAAGAEFLNAQGARIGKTYNTYNGESDLSQILQYAEVLFDDEEEDEARYVLLQIHGGADARGGYTDAKLFRYREGRFENHRDDFNYQHANVSIEIKNGRKKAVTFDKYGPGSDWVDTEGRSAGELPLTEKSKITAYVDFGH